MPTFIYLAAIAEMAVVKRVGENELYLVFMERIAVPTFHAVLKEKFGNILIAGVTLRIQLDGGDHRLVFLPVNHDGLCSHVIQITHGSGSGEYPHPCFLPQSSARVGTKVADELIGHAELDRHEEHVVGRIIALFRRGDTLDGSLLEQPTHQPIVHRIAGETIQLPTDDALRLASLDAVHHVVKHRTAGHFGRSALGELGRNLQPFALSKRAQFLQLAFNRKNLLVLDIGAFASVEEIGHVYSIS